MLRHFFKAMRVLSALLDWQATALADGKITINEIVDLVKRISDIFGFPVEFAIPDKIANEVLGVTMIDDQVIIK